MRVDRLDHLVLTVRDIDATVAFCTTVLGMREVTFDGGGRAVTFGHSKIDLHRAGREFEPKAEHPTPGSADLCLIVDQNIDAVIAELAAHHVRVEESPVERADATGPMTSVYLRAILDHMTITSDTTLRGVLDVRAAAAGLREKFADGQRMRIGDSPVVHDVASWRWLGGEYIPLPACHTAIGWEPLRLSPTWAAASCGSCAKIRAEVEGMLLPGGSVRPPLWLPGQCVEAQDALFDVA
ncbi:VOC family protein [Streptomyces sp. UNOB3_S3]|uniref:VOC family protein n=1 Tax=Streptomyces sp. UNOB3_S3 TaxID=2871682 RepID=UPI001E4D032A|nr:VOC family protein [Streptomyces sp. UNOB3_S3]MCC3778819.1 VOC family protein [Streptomyces sp. UNOB3_S3]